MRTSTEGVDRWVRAEGKDANRAERSPRACMTFWDSEWFTQLRIRREIARRALLPPVQSIQGLRLRGSGILA